MAVKPLGIQKFPGSQSPGGGKELRVLGLFVRGSLQRRWPTRRTSGNTICPRHKSKYSKCKITRTGLLCSGKRQLPGAEPSEGGWVGSGFQLLQSSGPGTPPPSLPHEHLSDDPPASQVGTGRDCRASVGRCVNLSSETKRTCGGDGLNCAPWQLLVKVPTPAPENAPNLERGLLQALLVKMRLHRRKVASDPM